MLRSPTAWTSLSEEESPSLQMWSGTAMGIASCGTAGASLRLSPSTSLAIGSTYLSSCVLKGHDFPTSWRVAEMAASAVVTDETLIGTPWP